MRGLRRAACFGVATRMPTPRPRFHHDHRLAMAPAKSATYVSEAEQCVSHYDTITHYAESHFKSLVQVLTLLLSAK